MAICDSTFSFIPMSRWLSSPTLICYTQLSWNSHLPTSALLSRWFEPQLTLCPTSTAKASEPVSISFFPQCIPLGKNELDIEMMSLPSLKSFNGFSSHSNTKFVVYKAPPFSLMPSSTPLPSAPPSEDLLSVLDCSEFFPPQKLSTYCCLETSLDLWTVFVLGSPLLLKLQKNRY